MAKCKSCGADIVWIKTVNGKSMPCNACQVVYKQCKDGKQTIIMPNGETIKGNITDDSNNATGIGYIPHWATCPTANQHRKKQKAGESPLL